MSLHPVYKSLAIEKDKKSFLKGYHISLEQVDIFVNLEMTDFDFETEAKNIADSILEILQKHIGESGEQSVYDRFEESLKQINYFLNDLKSKKESGDIGKMNTVIGILEDKTLHITKTGFAEAYLLRKGNIIDISEGLYNLKGNDPNYFINIASGDLEMGDKILFASKRVLKFVGKSDLNSMFITSDIDTSFQEMKSALLAEETGDIFINGFFLDKPVTKEIKKDLSSKTETTTVTSSATWGEKIPHLVKSGTEKMKNFITDFPQRIKEPTQRRNVIILGVILVIAILLISITFSSNSKTKSELIQKAEATLQSARDRLTDAQHQKLYDMKLAKTSLDEAKKKALEVRNTGLFIGDFNQLMKEIEKEEEAMDKITRIDTPLVFVDLGKKDQNISAIRLINMNQTFYVLSTNSVLGPIVDSAPDSYSKNIVENSEIIISGDKFLDQNVLVLLTRSNKIIEFKDNNFTFVDTEDIVWKPSIEVKTYGDRQYIYLLDPTNSNIWKYERTKKNYKGGVSYNADKVDLKDAVSFAIDGNIYVLKQNGEVKKMYAQKLQNFTIEGGPSLPLQNLDIRAKIYTTENLRNIYILDPINERVLVYKKTTFENPEKMTYEKQYILKGTELRDFYVDDTEQNMYLLTPQKILKIDIKSS